MAADEHLSEQSEEAPTRAWTRLDWIAIVGVTLVAGILRLIRLADPRSLVFDETYYAKDACWYVNVSESICDTGSEITQVHPPLGKWLLAIGIRLFGYDSFGWRISAAVAGIISVALLYLLARKLFNSTMAATLSSGLLALDFLHFVQSRTAMLDIFMMMFGTAAVLFCVYDREYLLSRVESNPIFDRPWRVAAGAAAGAATACKWNGAFFLLLVFVLSVIWEVAARRRDQEGDESKGGGSALARLGSFKPIASIAIWLILLPLIVYLFTFLGRIEWSEGTWYEAVWDRHKYMVDFHTNLTSHHSYESPAWSWILLKRPVSYFFCSHDDCKPPVKENDYQEIFAAGNPFVWWPSVLALGYAAYVWVRKRDFTQPEGVIVGGFATTYLLWVPLSLTGRSATFIFYLLPAIPFMCLALGYIASKIGRSWEAIGAISLFCVGVLASFVFYYPLLAKVTIPQPDWDKRIWIFDDCDPGEGVATTTTVTETEARKTRTYATETTTTESIPPPGWCWI